MKKTIDLSLIRSDAVAQLPASAQELCMRALDAIDWGSGNRAVNLKAADYDTITEMVRECIKLAGGNINGNLWMMVLAMRIYENRDALNMRWPYPVAHCDDHAYTRSIAGRMFACVAVWRLELATRAIKDGDLMKAIDEIALAGLALHFGGVFEGGNAVDESHLYQRRNAALRAALASHATHNDNKQTARDWYAAHKTMTKDAAAEKLVRDGIITASFRTVRDYLVGQ
jgi:hypothetical protein